MFNIFDSGSYQKSLNFNNILRITLDFAKQRKHKHLIQTLIGFLTGITTTTTLRVNAQKGLHVIG